MSAPRASEDSSPHLQSYEVFSDYKRKAVKNRLSLANRAERDGRKKG